jgi:tetratricopeptide (TPR) repeat protein
MAIAIVLNEIRVYVVAAALAEHVPEDLGGVVQMWSQYGDLSEPSLNLGVIPLERALIRRSILLSDRTFARYRAASVTVYEREWRATRDALAFAVSVSPSDPQLKAATRYCEGHLRRIDGEARGKDKRAPTARQELAAAVTAFREAAQLRPDWPDPFLGLMRTFVAMDDIERAADALAQAQRYGYTPGNREWALLGEGYFMRGTKLADSVELEPLARAADAYAQAIAQLSKATGYGNVTQRLREAQRRLQEVQERIGKASLPSELTA